MNFCVGPWPQDAEQGHSKGPILHPSIAEPRFPPVENTTDKRQSVTQPPQSSVLPIVVVRSCGEASGVGSPPFSTPAHLRSRAGGKSGVYPRRDFARGRRWWGRRSLQLPAPPRLRGRRPFAAQTVGHQSRRGRGRWARLRRLGRTGWRCDTAAVFAARNVAPTTQVITPGQFQRRGGQTSIDREQASLAGDTWSWGRSSLPGRRSWRRGIQTAEPAHVPVHTQVGLSPCRLHYGGASRGSLPGRDGPLPGGRCASSGSRSHIEVAGVWHRLQWRLEKR